MSTFLPFPLHLFQRRSSTESEKYVAPYFLLFLLILFLLLTFYFFQSNVCVCLKTLKLFSIICFSLSCIFPHYLKYYKNPFNLTSLCSFSLTSPCSCFLAYSFSLSRSLSLTHSHTHTLSASLVIVQTQMLFRFL